MSEFNTSLLREKFVIHDAMPSELTGDETITALSNRMKVKLVSKDRITSETYVVRAQNMHTTVRLAAQMVKDFYDYGSLTERPDPFRWDKAYTSITKGYEEQYNPQRWVAVYQGGRSVFEDGPGERHPFLDIVEQCDARNKGDYEKAMEIAKDAFKQAGKLVNIEHDSNVALIMKVTEQEGKCGVILRGPNKTTTFNMTAHAKKGRPVRPSQCLTAAAAFLEGIQLAFLIGMSKQKLRYELIAHASDEAQKAEAASHKVGRLNSAISQFENMLNVSYRPDRPNFAAMIDDAEEFSRKILSAEIEAKIASGELDKGDWVV
ncbi:MAG: hypothetical protein H6869_09125 [Rhodospirillales bacterium]|nr:hypothetical protein [Rhodospirillales bacterium]